jgi:hypothetical protein
MTSNSDNINIQDRLVSNGKNLQEIYVCENCDWSYSIPKEINVNNCLHCHKQNLSAVTSKDRRNDLKGSFELVVPFGITISRLKPYLERFTKGIPFFPKDLEISSLLSRIQLVFLPMWLVDTEVQAKWWAEAGFDYEVVSHQAQYDDYSRRWTSREVNESRIRWEPRLGTLSREYRNITVPALEEQINITRELGSYNLERAIDYRPHVTKESIICWPNRNTEDAWVEAQPEIKLAAGEDCRRAANADHIRDYKWDPNYESKNWTIILLPLYFTYYFNDENIIQPIFINGQTGRMSGVKWASMKAARKLSLILLIIALLIFVISLLAVAASFAVPLLLVLGILAFALSLVIGIGSAVPVILVWQFNRNLKSKPNGFFA